MDEIVRMTAEQWENYACEAHLLAFSVDRPTSFDRTHFALMYVKNKAPYMFVSCHEMDAETCYIQFGGTFQPERKDPSAFRAYLKMLGVL